MSVNVLSFAGMSQDIREAELVARAKLQFWMDHTRVSKSDIYQFAMQTLPKPLDNGDPGWYHLITILVSAEYDRQHEYWRRLTDEIKDTKTVKAFETRIQDTKTVKAFETRIQEERAANHQKPNLALVPRTEFEERILIQGNNNTKRRLGATGEITYEEWRALCDHFGNVCLRCGAAVRLTIDHVRPTVKGGTNTIENIQPLCKRCNSIKHAREIDYRNPDLLATFIRSLKHGKHLVD